MFENIIEQGAVSQLNDDILGGRNAPSMLFYGPGETGKGSSALELARVLSCESDALWKCTCPSCEKHRYLRHDDLLVLGKKSFCAEINAYFSVFSRNTSAQSAKLLFYRSIQKLILRFSPVLVEDDPKFAKISATLQSLDEKVNEFLFINTETAEKAVIEKLCKAIVKDASFLDEEGVSPLVPVGHIRKASYWCRLAPNGKRKTLIIENAENMRDESRNSLLKLLEEPPANVSIVLTSRGRETIIPTILSRLRQYRFLRRSEESEKEVLRRVFQVSTDSINAENVFKETRGSLISAYLYSFLPRNEEKMYPLAAYFIVSLARLASVSIKKNNRDIPRFLIALGERYAPISEAEGFERTVKSISLVKTLLVRSGNFEGDSFSGFLKLCLELVGMAAREGNDPRNIVYNDIFRKYIGEAITAVDILNQSATLALESLVYNIKTAIIKG
jgi:DNA polymerase-3 subunit gamma/tau